MNEQMMIDLVNRIADNDKVAPFQNGFVVLTNEEMVKFAELIVRECVYLCEITAAGKDAEAIQEAIQKHFGVKE